MYNGSSNLVESVDVVAVGAPWVCRWRFAAVCVAGSAIRCVCA